MQRAKFITHLLSHRCNFCTLTFIVCLAERHYGTGRQNRLKRFDWFTVPNRASKNQNAQHDCSDIQQYDSPIRPTFLSDESFDSSCLLHCRMKFIVKTLSMIVQRRYCFISRHLPSLIDVDHSRHLMDHSAFSDHWYHPTIAITNAIQMMARLLQKWKYTIPYPTKNSIWKWKMSTAEVERHWYDSVSNEQ